MVNPEKKYNLHTIVKEWLQAHGYDGLCNEFDCGCGVTDLMPCGEPGEHCMPAYMHSDLHPDGYYLYSPTKPEKESDNGNEKGAGS